jgi:hypothetical protein
MKRSHVQHLAVMTVTLGACAVVPRSARACSRASCEPPILPVKAGATVPANVPALRFDGLVTTNVVDLALSTDAGLAIDSRIERGDRYVQLVPMQPLSPGDAYRLKYRIACTGIDAGAELLEIPFSAGAAATIPAVLGHVDLAPLSIVQDPMPAFGLIVVGEFTVTSSAELRPFVPVTTFEVWLNGSPFPHSATLPGDVEAAGGKLVVRSMCSGALSTCGDYAALGSYMATVAAVIPGFAEPLVSPPLALELRCGELDGGSDAPDEATPPTDAPAPIDAPPQTDTPAVPPADGSCNCSTPGKAIRAPWWALLPMAFVCRRRRRRPAP